MRARAHVCACMCLARPPVLLVWVSFAVSDKWVCGACSRVVSAFRYETCQTMLPASRALDAPDQRLTIEVNQLCTQLSELCVCVWLLPARPSWWLPSRFSHGVAWWFVICMCAALAAGTPAPSAPSLRCSCCLEPSPA